MILDDEVNEKKERGEKTKKSSSSSSSERGLRLRVVEGVNEVGNIWGVFMVRGV